MIYCKSVVKILIMERLFVVTHSVLQTEIPTLLGSWVTNTRCYVNKNCLTLYFRKNVTCLNVSLLNIGQVFSLLCKVVYRWVTRNCFFMNGMYNFTSCVQMI